jgi:LacI family transcriptional regulator
MAGRKDSERKLVTVRDLARLLGVSIGTVDRALHNRPEVSNATRRQVLQAAKKLGYRPNQTARFLSTKRKLRIAVCLPEEIAAYFQQIARGIEEEALRLASHGVGLEFHWFPKLGEGEEAAFQSAVDSGVNGIILVPGRGAKLKRHVQEANRVGIPVMCVATDAPGTDRLSVVSVDPYASGALAGELLGRFVSGRGSVALVTGDLSISDHAHKLKAYSHISQKLFPDLQLHVVEAHDDEEEAYEKVHDLIEQHNDLSGVYISTINALPVLRALEQKRLLGKVTLIATDLFSELVPRIKSAEVTATIYQRPQTQGHIALRALWRFLVEGEQPPPQIRLAPHLVMRGNLSFFLAQRPFQRRQPNSKITI